MGLNWTKVFYTDAYSAQSSLGGHHFSLTIHLSPFWKEYLGSFGYLPNRKKGSTCGWRHSSPVNLATSHALIPQLRVQYPTVCGRDSEIHYRKKADRQPTESGRCPTLIKMADSREGREGKRKEKPQTQMPWCYDIYSVSKVENSRLNDDGHYRRLVATASLYSTLTVTYHTLPLLYVPPIVLLILHERSPFFSFTFNTLSPKKAKRPAAASHTVNICALCACS